jgi:hypothetical protein
MEEEKTKIKFWKIVTFIAWFLCGVLVIGGNFVFGWEVTVYEYFFCWFVLMINLLGNYVQ